MTRYTLAFLAGVLVTVAVVVALLECEYRRAVAVRLREW